LLTKSPFTGNEIGCKANSDWTKQMPYFITDQSEETSHCKSKMAAVDIDSGKDDKFTSTVTQFFEMVPLRRMKWQVTELFD